MNDTSPNDWPDDDDDAWLAQLRQAMATGEVAEPSPQSPPFPTRADANGNGNGTGSGTEASADVAAGPVGLASIRDAVRFLGVRMATVESLVEDIARTVRRAGEGSSAADLELVVTRVLRAELPALLEQHLASQPAEATVALGDETLARWAERADAGEVPSADVVLLANELRSRISQLEDLQRKALEQLAADRKSLIDDAVGEIRTLLFGT